MSAKLAACVVFALALMAAAVALLLAGILEGEPSAEKTFAGAHFIQNTPEPNGFEESIQEESRVSEHTLRVACDDAGRAGGQGNAL